MPTFTTKDTDTTDIDPESLTVNLTGFGPDPDSDSDDTPAGGGDPEKESPAEALAEGSQTENSVTVPSEAAEVDEDNSSLAPHSEEEEAEIRTIEDKLRGKNTAESEPDQTIPKKKKDPVVIVSIVVAAALIFVFVAYFTGFFESRNTLKMTTSEFSEAYGKTSGYKAIKKYGFAFPSLTLSSADETDASGATVTTTTRSFSEAVDNTLNYQMYVSGEVNKSDENIKSMNVTLFLNSSSSFSDALYSLYIPYIQVLYPSMSRSDAQALLADLKSSEADYTAKGNYALAFKADTSSGYFIGILKIVPKSDAQSLAAATTAAETTASAANAAETSAAS